MNDLPQKRSLLVGVYWHDRAKRESRPFAYVMLASNWLALRAMSISDAILEELRAKFRDALNYGAADVLSPIDPLTYRNPEGDTCLHLAAINGDGRTVGLLLDAGLDIDARGDMSQTALHYARAFKHDHIVELLLKRGATRGLIDEFGKES